MAVAPTGNIFKALEFDGESSKQYGVYITGEAVYNAPERQVEMIAIPGRNGAYALDKGRFENIEVTYPAGIFADNELDFAEAISDFRNFLCSKKGYVRLTDDYNPTEYRMAIYKSGLEVTPAQLRAGEFEITFECKPQRWLLSGETAMSVTSGDEINNPTLFDSSPLLEVEGYGDIGIGSQSITLDNITLGEITLNSGRTITNVWSQDYVVPLTLSNLQSLNIGDDIIVPASTYTRNDQYPDDSAFLSATLTSMDNMDSATLSITGKTSVTLNCTLSQTTFVYGTASTASLMKATWTVTYSGGTRSVGCQVQYDYDGNDTIDVHILYAYYSSNKSIKVTIPYIAGDSTLPALTGSVYIDLDIGEAWTENSGDVVPINNAVILPAILPTLNPGANEITYDNTITSFKITPRWWKV